MHEASTGIATQPQPPHVLIVEDDPEVAAITAHYLRGQGLGVRAVGDGSALFDALAHSQVDVVLLDLGLPGEDGLAILRELRTRWKGPVIIVSGRGEPVERVVGLELGADDYVTKPFSPRELVARVRVVLRRGHGGNAFGASAHGFEHDAEGHRIRYQGRLLDLTRYEYGLLAALLQRPGAVLSRAQLMDRVWGDALDSGDRTIDTHIKTLRAKLRTVAPEADPIRTHRGLGYSLESA